MKLINDGDKFDEMQTTLVGALVESIKEELESVKLQPEMVRELLGKIAFSIAAILDGSRDTTFKGSDAFPFITFQDENDDLISSGGGSWMHEYVFGTISDIYGE